MLKHIARIFGAAFLLGAAGCELTEVSLAVPEDVIVAEVILRPGAERQTAYLHRTTSGRGSARVMDATVHIYEHGGTEPLVLVAADDSTCLKPAPGGTSPELGTCYVSQRGVAPIRYGTGYRLEIVLAEGRRLGGNTTVPGEFEITSPSVPACNLQPRTPLELVWTRSQGASVYIGETRLLGVQTALRAAGVPVEGSRPIDLIGLAIGAADTTMLFPADFGVFDRFDPDLHGILVAIRDGLPPQVGAVIAVAAADLNYVNWVRGGSFNPSGTVRVPSVHGDGTGVFGSLVVRGLSLQTNGSDTDPPCAR